MAVQVLVHLRCPRCGGLYFLPRKWWAVRLLAGKPRMKCRSCDPSAYRTDLADRPNPHSAP